MNPPPIAVDHRCRFKLRALIIEFEVAQKPAHFIEVWIVGGILLVRQRL
jgi:hypothetical protein